MTTGDKIVNLDDLKVAYDALNASKLDKDFSSLDTSGGFSLSDTIPVNISGTTYKITGQTLSNAIGGGGGTQQASLTNYVKNCGTISVLPVTLTDSNITSDMIVIEYTIGDETALGSDWTVTTADGSLTISGTLNKSTTLQLVLSVGYSTTPSILTNLASDTADNVLKASPRPGVTGVLPLLHGGVGSSTASGARTNLSVYSKAETDSAISQSMAAETLFNSPKYLASGTDLDTLTTAGVYACEGAGVASTLINCPIANNNFSLLVLRSSTGRFKQVIFALDTIYVRYNAANGWDGWNPYYSTATTFGTNSATSFDNLTMPGLFGVTISTTGKRPVSNVGSYAAIVLSGSLTSTNAAITQIAIPTGSNTPNGVYIRNRSAAGVWSGWYKISTSAVS